MALVFYLLGWLCIVSGGFYTWTLIANGVAPAGEAASAAANVVLVSLALPGLLVMVGGLVLLGIGAVLVRLNKIVANTALQARPPLTKRSATEWEPIGRDREPRLM